MIEKEEIDYLANLSKIYLTSQEKEELSQDLSKIINFIDKIEQVDTTGLEPLYNVMTDHVNFLRCDEVKRSLGPEEIEKSTDHFHSGYYVVPQIIE